MMAPELVGRASEIPVVESLLAGIADGGGSLLVLGDPGIGKSALVEAASRRAADGGIRVRRTAADVGVDVVWLETPLDAEFSPICQRRADAGLGWITAASESLPAPLDVMSLGEFEPVAWVPSPHPAASRGGIGLDELAGMDVVHGPRRVSPGIYDAWLAVLRTRNPHFEFTDPPFRRSLPMTLAFAASASQHATVLPARTTVSGPNPR